MSFKLRHLSLGIREHYYKQYIFVFIVILLHFPAEREILEARQETQTKLHEENHAIEQERHLNSAELSQSETDVHGKDAAEKHDIQVNEKERAAPLAQAEDSDDDMSSDNIRKSRFAEVLRQKEAAAKESQRSAASQKRIDSGPKNAATKSTSSYLSSKFMKSRTLFEGKNEKSSVEARKGTAVSQPRSRRLTQETADNNKRNETTKADAGKERFRGGIDGKRALFQKANSVDATTSSDTGRVPLRERNKDSLGSTSMKKENASIETAPEESVTKDTGAASKLPVRRLVSDSVLKSRSSERSEEENRERLREIYEETKTQRKKEHEKERTEHVSNEVVKSDISKNVNEKKIEGSELQVRDDKKLQEAAENGFFKTVSGSAADDVVSLRKPLNDMTEQSLQLEKKADLKYENEPLPHRRKENTEVLHKQSEESENIPGDLHESYEETNGPKIQENNFRENLDSRAPQIVVSENQTELEMASDNSPGKEIPDETEDSKEIVGERIGSRRRRERRAHRMKQVDPLEIEKVKEQMRRDSTVNSHTDLDMNDKSIEDRPKIVIEKSIDQGVADGESPMLDARLAAGRKEGEEQHAQEHDGTGVADANNLNDANTKYGVHGRDVPRIGSIIDEKLSETDTGDESAGSTGSATKLTTRSVIKDKIRQKKFDKQLRKERTLSLPIGVEVVVTPPIEKKPALSIEVNGTRSPLLRTKPPVMPKIQRSQEADDVSSLQKKTKRPLRSRPKTLTQGIDPSLLVSDIKAKEEAVVVEERLSISQLKQRLLQSESGSRTPRTPDVQRKNKRRSGKRYKTITEGIAPGLLEAAHQMASHEQDPNRLGVDHMNKLNLALSASTENLKRRSFIVSEVNSRIGSVGASLATSMEDLSMKENGHDNERVGSVVEESIKKLKKLPMVVDSDEDDPMPSVSSLKQKFLQAVEDSYKPVKNKVTKRAKGRQRDRPFTISGLDDVTMLQLRHSIDERNERNIEEKTSECTGDTKVEKGQAEKIDELAEDELEDMLKAEGLTADQLASELGINPSLAQGSPLRARKPFLGTTTEESPDDVLEVIHETSEKQEKDVKPLGELRSKFMDAMNEFKSGSFDKETDTEKPINVEEKEPNTRRKERRIGVVDSAERVSIELTGEDEPNSDLDFVSQNVTQYVSVYYFHHNLNLYQNFCLHKEY